MSDVRGLVEENAVISVILGVVLLVYAFSFYSFPPKFAEITPLGYVAAGVSYYLVFVGGRELFDGQDVY